MVGSNIEDSVCFRNSCQQGVGCVIRTPILRGILFFVIYRIEMLFYAERGADRK